MQSYEHLTAGTIAHDVINSSNNLDFERRKTVSSRVENKRNLELFVDFRETPHDVTSILVHRNKSWTDPSRHKFPLELEVVRFTVGSRAWFIHQTSQTTAGREKTAPQVHSRFTPYMASCDRINLLLSIQRFFFTLDFSDFAKSDVSARKLHFSWPKSCSCFTHIRFTHSRAPRSHEWAYAEVHTTHASDAGEEENGSWERKFCIFELERWPPSHTIGDSSRRAWSESERRRARCLNISSFFDALRDIAWCCVWERFKDASRVIQLFAKPFADYEHESLSQSFFRFTTNLFISLQLNFRLRHASERSARWRKQFANVSRKHSSMGKFPKPEHASSWPWTERGSVV